MSLTPNSQRGFAPVLQNKEFRRLWAAQVSAQTAQYAVNFVLIVLVERLTGTSIHQGLMILAFTLPGVIFAPVSGIVIDRWPKKWILVGSNALRALLVIATLLILQVAQGRPSWWLLPALYCVAFVGATIGQFFNPAEAATIPLLVGRDLLIPANSLFTLTLALAQIVGLIILGPLAVKLIGIEPAFVLIAGMYGVAALFVGRLPRDEPTKRPQSAMSGWQRAWAELKEGGEFLVKRPSVWVPMMHLTLIASLVMVMAMLAPGIASRVLNLAPEDAIVVFAPAGVGMLAAAALLGRWGYRYSKTRLVRLGLTAMAAGFAGFGWVAWRFQNTQLSFVLDSSVMELPAASAALIVATVLLSFYLGLSMSGVNIVSQTSLQERSPEGLRGRVFSVQFMLNNLVGIPPMLLIGGLADLVGIPQMLVGISLAILGVLGWTIYTESRHSRRPLQPIFVAGLDGPPPGVSPTAGQPSLPPAQSTQPETLPLTLPLQPASSAPAADLE